MPDANLVSLYASRGHAALLLPDADTGPAAQTNQHLIVHNREAVLLDPGGEVVYSLVMSATHRALRSGGVLEQGARLKHVVLTSHDPDAVGALNGWLMTTDATAWLSELSLPSVAHNFACHSGDRQSGERLGNERHGRVDRLVLDRVEVIPDTGAFLPVGGVELMLVPAPYLPSPAGFHVYDPHTRILYTGALGSSFGAPGRLVDDFDRHVPFMASFHHRQLPANAVVQGWLEMVRELDVHAIAPQHGAVYQGKAMVERFFEWLGYLECGVDAFPELYSLPRR